jgi:hypothetical protein
MNCFVHDRVPANGMCAVCQKAVCRDCVGREMPRLVCRTCLEQRAGFGFDYRSEASFGGWPLIHVCTGFDPVTMRPRVAKGVVAIGNIAIGGVAIAGIALGLVSAGGLSIGLLFAVGGAALGLGFSIGGVAVGAVAVGGAAFGYLHALGGAAFAPSIIDGSRCDREAADFFRRWLGSSIIPPSCR